MLLFFQSLISVSLLSISIESEVDMKAFKKTSSVAFYHIHSGFQAFKKRLAQELIVSKGVNLDDYADDDNLFPYYRQGESISYVMASLCGSCDD